MTLFKSYTELMCEFYKNQKLRNKYLTNYDIRIVKTLNNTQAILTLRENNIIRDVHNVDLYYLQTELALNENIHIYNISVLSRALINCMLQINKDNNIEVMTETNVTTDEEMLEQLIDECYNSNKKVEPKVILTMFGLNVKEFKHYDQTLAKILKSKDFVKQRKSVKGKMITFYIKS